MYSYLSNLTQRMKINKNFSDRTDIEFGVSQCSVLGSLVFSIDMIDPFCKCEDSNLASYAADTTPCSCATHIPSVVVELNTSTSKLFH